VSPDNKKQNNSTSIVTLLHQVHIGLLEKFISQDFRHCQQQYFITANNKATQQNGFKMMTPRCLTMGNKVYKLHVKHGSNKKTVSMSPDSTVHQLKQKIADIFQIPEGNQRLMLNGRSMELNEDTTLKQGRIANGSKILVQSMTVLQPETTPVHHQPPSPAVHLADRVNADAGGTHAQQSLPSREEGDTHRVDGGEGYSSQDVSGEQMQCLLQIEARGLQIEKLVKQIELDLSKLITSPLEQRGEMMRAMKKQNSVNGELLMNELEALDRLRIEQQEVECRAYRKRVANLLNRVLDLNDENAQNISKAIAATHKAT